MSRTITLPDDVYARLERLAQPFVDKEPADVIRRLLNGADALSRNSKNGPVPSAEELGAASLEARAPRERGAKVELDGKLLAADSVRDLYEQVLHALAKNGSWHKIKSLVPYRTSSKRYLVAEKPVHPNGNPFVVPVEFRGVYMEAHKDYPTAIRQLQRFLAKGNVMVRYIG